MYVRSLAWQVRRMNGVEVEEEEQEDGNYLGID